MTTDRLSELLIERRTRLREIETRLGNRTLETDPAQVVLDRLVVKELRENLRALSAAYHSAKAKQGRQSI